MADPALFTPQTSAPEAAPAAPTQNGTPILAPEAAQPDVDMADSTPGPDAQTPSHNPPTPSHAPDPPVSAPTPTAAPQAAAMQTPTTSRNSPHPITATSMPAHPSVHGGPTRIYLNQNVTPYLLEGMKHLVTNEPDKPLKWLSEFLAQKSLEIEGP